MKYRIPTPTLPPTPTEVAKQKCGTCQYKTPCRPEDLEMTIAYYVEAQQGHPCHERSGKFCHGSNEQMVELERLVAERIHSTV